MNAPEGNKATLEKTPFAVLRSFIDTGQFSQILANATWYSRASRLGSVQAVDSTRHGQLTGQVCDYVSQARMLESLSQLAGVQLDHFLGNIVRCSGKRDSWLYWEHPGRPDAGIALVANIGQTPAKIQNVQHDVSVDILPGDAAVMALGPNQRNELVITDLETTLIEGYFVRKPG